MKREIEIHFLEMAAPAELVPSTRSAPRFRVEQACVPAPELNRFFYTAVGGDWYWTDRLGWNYDRWLAWIDRPGHETWIGSFGGTPAGFFELERQAGGLVELVLFGLLPEFIGRGLGGILLTAAVERAWQLGGSCVRVNTCSLDAPGALANYQARGFRLVRTVTRIKDLPDEPPGPWPKARWPALHPAPSLFDPPA
jgi:GNAT superfamily N-acetyltransferase